MTNHYETSESLERKAYELYLRDDFLSSLRYYKLAAEMGSKKALQMIACIYDNGFGVPQNDKEAIKWYLKAAEKGNVVALYNIGWIYEHGRSVPQNNDEAIWYYKLAAELGCEDARIRLSELIRHW